MVDEAGVAPPSPQGSAPKDPDADKPGEPGLTSLVQGKGLLAGVAALLVLVALLVGYNQLDEDDDIRSESPRPTVGAAATTAPTPAASAAGSADRLQDLFDGLPPGPMFEDLTPVGDVVDQPTAGDLWFDLEPYAGQFDDLGYAGGQSAAYEAEPNADGSLVVDAVALVSVQRWEFDDQAGATQSFEVYRSFVESRAPVAEDGSVAVGDQGTSLVSRSSGDPALSTIVTLSRVGNVVLMTEGSCQGCTPATEQDALGQMQEFAEGFFAE